MDTNKINLGWVASTSQGRHFLWDTLSFCGVYQDFAGDPNDVFKNLGKREVGLHLLGLLADVDDELIFTMMREAKDRQIAQEIKDNGTTSSSTSSDTSTSTSTSTSSDTSSDDFDFIGKHESGGANL